ncbi:MAG: RluA family pseudouridine synthase [Halocynthiibacter sp.]
MSQVQFLEVSSDDDDQRLDRWFRRLFPHVTQGRIEKMCRKGDIRVDKGRVKSSHRLVAGQVVRVPPLPDKDHQPAPKHIPSRVSDADAKMIQSTVLYKDDYIIAINKPPGLPTQGGSKQKRHVDGMTEALKFDYEEKPRLVHRLDKDTSGVLLLARTRKVASDLTKAFRHRDTRKIYWAAVAGAPMPRVGTVKYGLVKAAGHGPHGAGEKMICIHPREVEETRDAKHATTDYAVLSNLGGRTCWVALVPITGRTHQLRAHMAEIGHPIIGDGKYGGSGQENLGDGWGAGLGGELSKKLHLHARLITFEHPVTKKIQTITAELPPHMEQTWDMLGWHENDVEADPFEDM